MWWEKMKQHEIMRYLPEVFRRTVKSENPLEIILETMEKMHEPGEQVLDSLDMYFDPRRTEDALVPFMSYWINLEWLLTEEQKNGKNLKLENQEHLTNGLGRLRELIANASFLSKWRGTADGIKLFIIIATGVKSVEIQTNITHDHKKSLPYHFIIKIREDARRFEPVLNIIIEHEKPAYTTYEILFG
jgi:phage tail-like protein